MDTDRRRANALSLAALVGGAFGIGWAPIFVRWSEVGPVATAFWRLLFASLMLAVWTARPSARRQRRQTPVTARDRRLVVLCGFFFACDLGVWHWSIELTTVANSTLLANFMPVFVTLLGGWLFRVRIPRAFWGALVVALAGAVLVVQPQVRGGRQLLGDALGLLTALFYASYFLTVAKLRERRSSSWIIGRMALAASPPLLVAALLSAEPMMPGTARAWLVLAGLAFVGSVVGQNLAAWALAHLPAAFSALVLLLQPLTAILLAWWLFGESLSPAQLAGVPVLLCGIWWAQRLWRTPAAAGSAESGSEE